MAYLGSTPTTQSFISGTDYFNGTGSQTAFTLTRSVASVNDIQAVVNNVVQVPNDAYTLSGTTITFTSAPSSGTNNVYVRYLSTTTQVITPSQNSVGTAQLASLTTIPVAGGYTVTLPSATGTAMVSGNMPAFSAYASSNQTVSSAADTKITLDTELFDTNSNFASSRFTPTVSGYYQISATIKMTCSGNLRRNDIELFKNGSLYQVGSSIDVGASSTGISFIQSTISTVMYFNGSSDYVELYVFPQANSGTLTVAGGSDKTWMSGCLMRAA
jgi:hypothetical protein